MSVDISTPQDSVKAYKVTVYTPKDALWVFTLRFHFNHYWLVKYGYIEYLVSQLLKRLAQWIVLAEVAAQQCGLNVSCLARSAALPPV